MSPRRAARDFDRSKGEYRRPKGFGSQEERRKRKKQTTERINAMKNKKCAVLVMLAFLAVALLIFGSNLQGQSKASPQLQLGGSFIGSSPSNPPTDPPIYNAIFEALQVPLDPAGRTAALHLKFHTWPAAFAKLFSGLGANTLTDSTGEVEMTGRDTFKLNWVAYGIEQGNPPVIRFVLVYTGEAQFTGPDSYNIAGDFYVYLASADIDKDGFPDETPLMIIPGSASAKRVPIP
jgi:hypothetical protein